MKKLTIYLTPELANAIESRCAASGMKKAPYVASILEKELFKKESNEKEDTLKSLLQVTLEQSFLWKRLYQMILSTKVPAETALAMLADAEHQAQADLRAALSE